MSKRLQVLLAPKEYRFFQQIAKGVGLSLGEWVRQTLRRAAGQLPKRSPEEILENIKRASLYNLPTDPIDQILSEIQKGKLSDIEQGIK